MFDYHVHTDFSSDCVFSMEEMIKGAVYNGLKEICFTDHVDYDYMDDTISFDVDFKKFDSIYLPLKEKYRDIITLKKGVEIGMQPHVIKRCDTLVQENNFDFVIGSVHTCNKLDLYRGDFYKGKTPDEAWDTFLRETIESAKEFKGLNVIGHLDIIKRYDPSVRKIDINNFRGHFEELFRFLSYNGKGIEINTSGMRGDLLSPLPSLDILKMYKEYGGEIITLGSDSHAPDTLGFGFERATEMLQQIGFKYICTFENSKPVFKKI